MIAYRWISSVSAHLGPFPGDSADAVALVKQRLICCRKQGVFKQTASLLALPPQRGEGLALVRNHHSPADDTNSVPLHRRKRPPLIQTTAFHLLLLDITFDS